MWLPRLSGLFAGELEGLLVGLAIGWVLNLFSAGELWLSLLTNGGVGLLAGFLGRQVSQVTSISLGVGLLLVSLASGLFAAMNFKQPRYVSDVVDGRVDRLSTGVF